MHHGPTLEVNLAAIRRNYTLLSGMLGSGGCAAVVKANAYGLGVRDVAPALYDAGCRDFFVATLDEAVELRAVLEQDVESRILTEDARIYAFHGVRSGEIREFTHHRILPVLNSLEQIHYWKNSGQAALHIDSGMRRLGISSTEAKRLAEEKKVPEHLKLIMSHLACANEAENPMNRQQLEEFTAIRNYFPDCAASLANSSGIFLGPEYHFDLARPGCSLYGISPNTSKGNPMENVVELSVPVLQYRELAEKQSVGYGATASAPKGAILATVELGYADGILRSLSNRLQGYAAGVRVPLLGRISMDMLIFDVSGVPARHRTPEMRISLIGKEQPVDVVAKEANTIGYEIFTRLGARVKRTYK